MMTVKSLVDALIIISARDFSFVVVIALDSSELNLSVSVSNVAVFANSQTSARPASSL